MRVTDYTIAMAVLRIFRDYRVFHDGGTLLLSDVAQAWKETGLRTRDLDTGFRWLEAHLCARRGVEAAGGEPTLRLLPNGASHLSDFPKRFSDWLDEMDAAITLMKTHRRVHRGELLRRVRCSLHGIRPGFAAAA